MSIKTRVGKVVQVINQNKSKKAASEYSAVLVKLDGKVTPLLLTNIELEVAQSRAKKNVEDTLEQNLFSKLVD
jgi:hypothetical protein